MTNSILIPTHENWHKKPNQFCCRLESVWRIWNAEIRRETAGHDPRVLQIPAGSGVL